MPAASAVVFLRLIAMAFGIELVTALWQVLADQTMAGRFAKEAMTVFSIAMLLLLLFVWRIAPFIIRLMTPVGFDDDDNAVDGGTLFGAGAALLGLWELLHAITPVVTLASIASESEIFPPMPPEAIADPVIRLLASVLLIAFAGRLGRWFRRSIKRQGLR